MNKIKPKTKKRKRTVKKPLTVENPMTATETGFLQYGPLESIYPEEHSTWYTPSAWRHYPCLIAKEFKELNRTDKERTASKETHCYIGIGILFIVTVAIFGILSVL